MSPAPSGATSENNAASWVQPTVSGAPEAAALRKVSSSARQSWCAVVTSPPRQPRRTVSGSSGMVSSHEQIRWCRGLSAIHRSLFRVRVARRVSRHRWPGRWAGYRYSKREVRVRDSPMPPGSSGRARTPPALDLPPPFRLVTLREVGDAFAHAKAVAASEGAGTLVHVGRFDLAEFAV